MRDQTTIGYLTLTLLGLTSEAGKRGILGDATRRAWARLKENVAAWSSNDAEVFDDLNMPASLRRRIIDAIELRSIDDRVTIRSLTGALAESLREDVLRGSLGISLRRLEQIDDQLRMLS
jgi:hypothetical protein